MGRIKTTKKPRNTWRKVVKAIGLAHLCLFVLITSTQNGLNLLVYEVAKPIIIKNYCVNTDNPELKCNGKCHLATMMGADETSPVGPTSSDIPPPEFKYQINFFLLPSPLEMIVPEPEHSFCASYLPPIVQSDASSIFHPPQSLIRT